MEKKNKFLNNTIYAVIVLIIIISLLLYSRELSASLLKSIETCLTSLIPSLFLFMIISNFSVKTGVLDILLKPFSIIVKYIFRCDPSLTSTVFMSMIGGYPVGAKLLSNLYFENRISKKTVERMLCFCVNAGPSYIIGTVAIPLFGSVKIGFIIFISHILAAFCIGFITGIGRKREAVSLTKKGIAYPSALVGAVNTSIRAMANMCGFVLLFSGILSLLEQFSVIDSFAVFIENIFLVNAASSKSVVYGLLEITNGISQCNRLSGLSAVLIVTAITAFGGICVHLQALSMFHGEKISMLPFYILRMFYVCISTAITYIILLNDSSLYQDVFLHSTNIHTEISQISPMGSIFLLILSFMLLLSSKKSVTILK